MGEEKLSDSKLYELALEEKKHKEDRRDEVTKNYTSLFTAVVAAMPFIDSFIHESQPDRYNNIARFLQLLLPFIGLILSISWIAAMKRTYLYLEGIDKFLIAIENKYNRPFISSVEYYLDANNAPQRVTKQVMWTPYTFSFVFLLSTIYFSVDFLTRL